MATISTIKVDNIVYDIKAKYDTNGREISQTLTSHTNKIEALENKVSIFVTLSQAEYDALPDSKLTDGKYYCII